MHHQTQIKLINFLLLSFSSSSSRRICERDWFSRWIRSVAKVGGKEMRWARVNPSWQPCDFHSARATVSDLHSYQDTVFHFQSNLATVIDFDSVWATVFDFHSDQTAVFDFYSARAAGAGLNLFKSCKNFYSCIGLCWKRNEMGWGRGVMQADGWVISVRWQQHCARQTL